MTRVLIHIGYPKAGSTYLQTWFGKHPSMFYNGIAMTGFYNTHDISRYAEKNNSVHEHFILSSEHLSVWKGDVDIVGVKGTNIYDIPAYRERMCETLHRIYPGAKVLIVTRGFESMLKSLYSQYLAGGGIFTFDKLQNEFKEFFPYAYDYSAMVEVFRNKFGAENVLAIPYELLREDPKRVTSMIEDAIGVKEKFDFTTEKINQAIDKKTLKAYRTVSNFLYNVVQPFPYSFQKFVFGTYIYKLNQKRPHPFMIWLTRFIKNEVDIEVRADVLSSLINNGRLFVNEPLYQPYLKEYLL